MSEVIFSALLALAFVITAYVLYNYADWRKHNVVVTFSSLVAWYFSILMVFILPMDVALTYYDQCLTDLKVKYLDTSNVTNSSETSSHELHYVKEQSSPMKINASEFEKIATSTCPTPFLFVSRSVLVTFWAVVYWTLMVLTWTVLPITQSYAISGAFTILGKLKRVLIENAIYYGSFVFLFAVSLLFLATRTDMFSSANAGERLITLCAAAGNTWGLFLVVLFLGYGLVEVPMRFWNDANLSRTLRRTYYRVAQLNLQRAEVDERYANTLKECVALTEQLPNCNWPSDDRRRRFVRTIALRLPSSSEIDQLVNMRTLEQVDYATVTSGRLVSVHTRLIQDSQKRARTAVLFNEAVAKAISIETVLSACRSRLKTLQVRLKVKPSSAPRRARQQPETSGLSAAMRSVKQSVSKAFRTSRPLSVRAESDELVGSDERAQLINEGTSDFEAEIIGDELDPLNASTTVRLRHWLRQHWAKLHWAYYCLARSYVLRAVGLLTAGLSFVVVWSECTFSVQQPTLSLLALLVGSAGSSGQYLWTQLTSFGTLAYLSLCTYYTVFQLKLFDYFHLVRAHQTDENSVIFSATLFARLTPALCLNYLGLIHLDTHVIRSTQQDRNETAYTQIMGHMDVLTFLSDGFNIYFPILVCLLCVATYFKLGTRILHFFGFSQFLDNANDDELQQELIDEGAQIVRRKIERDAKQTQRVASARFTVNNNNQSTNEANSRPNTSESNLSRTSSSHRPLPSNDRAQFADDGFSEADRRVKMSAMLDEFDDTELNAAQSLPRNSATIPTSSAAWPRTSMQTPRANSGTSWPPSIFDDV